MNLQEFYDYKNQLMGDLLTNSKIIKLINDSATLDNAEQLLKYVQIFPCEYVPDTVEEGRVFVCFDVDILESQSKTYLIPVLYIWVFAHRSKLILPDGEGVRTDRLCSAICDQINGSMTYGQGELNLYSVKRFAPMTDYTGKVMTFRTRDINRLYNPKKYIPENRRTGDA